MGKSKTAKKKNNVSKHILKAREDGTATIDDADGKSSTPSKKKGKTNKHIKHPEEASSYLTQWKANKSEDDLVRASSSWKFNKNTQSWLIRHMYEVDKVPKPTFLLLLEYLEGLEGKIIKDRMRSDASRRCRRHKEYCKNNPDNNDEGRGETEKGSEINDGQIEAKNSSSVKTTSVDSELEYEQAMWEKLDDKEKRKQYKRSRKILDLMKNCNNDNSD
mmetsp:Transcript_22385/g.48701  ORF Transcript_22385/g.48701 Transcript_22385/m.48701 type:complete len:218 (+) Transcript_22385:131-784(+)|eukprot:CAMPEP_0168183456 /NCGR_PEP_ID=MMETSP0139_2-20121125/12565_1 /TAXON_ID=44445 /ORGANISM="Pseudo-nitzschia australis, Strain 10249 10 AB" /LENGTH=217 /DNA_ID=CAMNT_0008104711 /DNA_START=54 /DNA_END=707 /DNA_ORIENTATION=+